MPIVNPILLDWARNAAGLSLEDAARVLGIASAERLRSFETGEQNPSRTQLLNMAKRYRRPLLTFYLAEPPRKGNRGQDFRTLPPDQVQTSEVLLDTLIRDVQARHGLVRAVLQDEDEQPPLTFIGSARMEDGVEPLCRAIASALAFDLGDFRRHRTSELAFSYLRGRAENSGIFVLLIGNLGSHHTALPVETFRGFAIADNFAPFVVINDQDAKTAWSFTLLHEITHLWLGTTGVSGGRAEQAIEQFCNDVAGELLLPRGELDGLRLDLDRGIDAAIAQIGDFARDRHVSRAMVAYKLHRLKIIDRNSWLALDGRLREMRINERAQLSASDEKRRISYYIVRRHRLGPALLGFANRAVISGALSPAKAARVLGVKPRNVYPLLHGQG